MFLSSGNQCIKVSLTKHAGTAYSTRRKQMEKAAYLIVFIIYDSFWS